MDAIARQPEAGATLSRTLFVGLAMIETMAIYCLVLALCSCSRIRSRAERCTSAVGRILFQAINFLVLVWLLRRFLYRPVLGVIDQRQSETDRVLREAAETRKAADVIRQECEQQRAGLGEERARSLAAAQIAAKAERESLLEASRAERLKLIAAARNRSAASAAKPSPP